MINNSNNNSNNNDSNHKNNPRNSVILQRYNLTVKLNQEQVLDLVNIYCNCFKNNTNTTVSQ